MADRVDRNQPTIDHPLPISKLRGVPAGIRMKLKSRRVTTCAQLLAVAAPARARAVLAETIGMDPALLLTIVWRADMARIKGIGTVFGLMLEQLGVVHIERLAEQDPAALHAALRRYNLKERLARRSPTLEEVESWIADARGMKFIVTHASESVAVD